VLSVAGLAVQLFLMPGHGGGVTLLGAALAAEADLVPSNGGSNSPLGVIHRLAASWALDLDGGDERHGVAVAVGGSLRDQEYDINEYYLFSV